MASRCAYKAGKRRCGRNGFGNPPLCRAHAMQVNLDKKVELSEESPLFGIIDIADRALSKSNNELIQQVRGIFGEFLAGAANQSNARAQAPPPPPPQQAPQAPDPREVLGFEPGEPLTVERVKVRKRDLAALYHPDRAGGSMTAMKRVNSAADELLRVIS